MAAFDSRSQTVDQKGASIGQEYKLQAQSPVLQKSFYQKLFEYLGQLKYIHPDLHVVIGGESLGVVTYSGSDSKSEIKISLPENTLLQHFTQTQNKTELQALIGNVTTVYTKNGNSDSNQKPALQSSNKSCLKDTDGEGGPKIMINVPHFCFPEAVYTKNGNSDSNQKPALQSSNKSCLKDTDNLNCKFLKMYDQWSDFTHNGDGYSLIEGYPEHEFPGRYHEIHDKEIGKETKEREIESTTDLSPDIFAKPGNSEVWKFMNERRKIPNTCKGKQTGRQRLDQEINWDELVQGIIVPDIDRTEDDQENRLFGSNLDKIKTEIIKPEQEFDKTVNDFHILKTEKKKLCKLCQERELDTIFLPCGHLVLCNFCCASQNIKLCPQCYKEIEHVNEAHF